MICKVLKLKFYVSCVLENILYFKEMEGLTKKIKSSLNVYVKKYIIDENGKEDLESKILWGLYVSKRIMIKQTRKLRSFYLQLVVFGNNKLITFYPQASDGGEMTIKSFEWLLKGESDVCMKSLKMGMN